MPSEPVDLSVDNVSTSTKPPRRQILTVGGMGTGKTTLFGSLPGKKFAYLFDPNALDALRKWDIDYKEFIVDDTDIDLSVKTLKHESKQVVIDRSSRKRKPSPMTYVNWEEDFEARMEAGYFNDYDWIMFDSATSFSDMIMDRVQFLNGRLNKHPEQADYTAQMNVHKNVMRVAASMTGLYCTAHVETLKDDVTGKIHGKIMMTGKNRFRIPLMFSHIFATILETTKVGEPNYQIQTIPTKENPVVRTSLDMNPFEDVDIKFNKPMAGQGLGQWFTV